MDKKINFNIPKEIMFFLEVLNTNNFEAYLVGGCVRDMLLHKNPKDYDITTNAKPEEIISCFNKAENIHHRGIEVLPTGLKHGTVTIIYHNKNNLVSSEITTYRTDGKYEDNRHPSEVQFVKNLSLDLSRRDLTINAMAYHPSIGIVDIYNGINDLNDKLIKTVGSPDDRFNEDALRMMRVIRFACQLNFDLENDVLTSIFRNKHLIKNVSSERVHDELIKSIMANPVKFLELFNKSGLLEEVIPELSSCVNFSQNNPYHQFDVFNHTIEACKHLIKAFDKPNNYPLFNKCYKDIKNIENVKQNLLLSLMFHDIGKSFKGIKTTSIDGIDHFYGHANKSVELTENILNRLKFSNYDKQMILTLVAKHDSLLNPTMRTMYKTLVKEQLDKNIFYLILIVQSMDIYAQSDLDKEKRLNNLIHVLNLYDDCIANRPYKISHLKTNGNIIKKQFPELKGKEIGIKLNEILTQCFYNPEKNIIN